MLASLRNELNQNDHLTIAFDGQDHDKVFDKVEAIVALLPAKGQVYMVNDTKSQERHEHALRNLHTVAPIAGDFCLFADDDDRYVQGFAQVVRDAVSIDVSALFFFRMYRFFKNDTIWGDPELFLSNVGTPNGVIPCSIMNQSTWGQGYFGDGEYYINLANQVPRFYFVDYTIYNVGRPKRDATDMP